MRLRQRILGATALMVAMSTGAAHAADITIGVAGPMTGQHAAFGEQMKRGAEQAVKDINAKGGVNGDMLKLVTGDDACDPKQAVAVANKMATDGAVFVAGHFCSGSSIPASQVYADEGVVMMSPGSTNPALTDAGHENVFRVCGRDDQQGAVAAKYIADHFKGKKVAIIQDQSAYGKGLADETQKGLHAAGIQEVAYEPYNAGERDYSALVTKLKATGAEVLYVGGYHPEAGLIARQLKDQGVTMQMVSGDALVTEEFWAISGPAGEGVLMTFGPDPRENPMAADVVKEFKAASYEPEGYTLYTYAAIKIFADAAAKAKSTKAEDVEKTLKEMSFQTPIGPISFDAKGDVKEPTYVMYKWHDGKYAEVK